MRCRPEFSQHAHSAQHTPPIPTETYRQHSPKTQVHTFRPVCEFCILPNLPRVPHVCPGAHSFSKSFLLEELLWSGERHKRSALCFCMKQQNLPSKQNPFFEGPQPSECFKLVLLGTKYNIGVDTHCVVFSNRISIVSH